MARNPRNKCPLFLNGGMLLVYYSTNNVKLLDDNKDRWTVVVKTVGNIKRDARSQPDRYVKLPVAVNLISIELPLRCSRRRPPQWSNFVNRVPKSLFSATANELPFPFSLLLLNWFKCCPPPPRQKIKYAIWKGNISFLKNYLKYKLILKKTNTYYALSFTVTAKYIALFLIIFFFTERFTKNSVFCKINMHWSNIRKICILE